MKSKIYYTKPSITDLEIHYASDAAKNGWGDNCYKYIELFEGLFRKHLNVKYAIATSSCTGAIHMGLVGLGIGNGDEVIMANTNWVAQASAIVHVGANPIFVDILPDSWCIDPELVEKAISPKTKAILAVHLYGNLCEMDKLLAIGKKYNIPIIEDAAEAVGSIYHGQRAGSMGKFGTFSFHGTKTLTTGEGGMFVTNDEELYEKVLTLSNHGRSRNQSKQFWPDMIGFKYKMSNIQAAIGCAQIERIEDLIEKKREILYFYKEQLKDISCINLNPEPLGIVNGSWMPTVVFSEDSKITREIIQSLFLEENIDARVCFWPLDSLTFFKPNFNCPVSYSFSSRAINLPSYHDITLEEILRVCNVIKAICKE